MSSPSAAYQEICRHSRHLALVLSRGLTNDELADVAQAFRFACDHGGLLELDFIRPDGASYNPRPARIALIVQQEAKLTEPTALSAAILAAVANADNQTELQHTFPALATLVETCLWPPEKLYDKSQTSCLVRVAAIISCSVFLDRARHLHQAPSETNVPLWKEVFAASADYAFLAKAVAPPLETLLSAWRERFWRNFLSSIAHDPIITL